ncbi:MAG: ribonuclease R [Bdellovibrionales bacterium]|nr:ribonuclease R [Bdellovibrionales bacterium]
MKNIPPPEKRMNMTEGVVKRHPDGFGFLIPKDPEKPDVYIPKKHMTGVMTNDHVLAMVFPEPGGDRFRGEIVRITKRSFDQVIGKIHHLNNEYYLVKDESHAWGSDLKVKKQTNIDVKDGDWVSIEIISYPDTEEGFVGKIKDRIGDVLDPAIDNKRVIIENQIPYEFSSEVINQAKQISQTVTDKDKKNRKDLSDLKLITIDGVTAKDLDDAIYVEQDHKGFRLIVAIADVSHYIKPGTALDEEAYKRGNSTYFPHYVVPMLPEELSNGICSLNPSVDRLALVSDMRISFQGEIESSEFYEAVIKTHARVTYGEAQELIDGSDVEKIMHVKDVIMSASDLAKILMKKRFKEGSLSLEIPETTIDVDEMGMPVDIIKSERVFAHKLIEELMLIANVATARFLGKNEVPALYRVHEEPKPEALQILVSYLNALGETVHLSGEKIQKKLSKAVEKYKGTPKETVLSVLTLRSMNQAKYSPHNVGHFGLGFSDYAHFTSPIRRYPDLIIHRLVKSVILKGSNYQRYPFDDLETAGVMLSATEQRSVKAERQVDGIKKARFMGQFVGEEFEGVISSVARFGVFVTLRQYSVDGLVKVEELGYGLEFDPDNLKLFSPKSGVSYSIGDTITVTVAAINIDQGQIDFTLGEELRKAIKEQSKSAKKTDRKKSGSNRKSESKKKSGFKEKSKNSKEKPRSKNSKSKQKNKSPRSKK